MISVEVTKKKTNQPTWTGIVNHYDNETEWKEGRKKGIGASEVAAIFGVGYSNQSPVTVWSSKCGIAEQDFDNETIRRMKRGKRMESIIAAEFEDETGFPVRDLGEFSTYQSIDCPILFATLDRITVHPEFGAIPVELKNVNGRFRNDWDEEQEPPLKYMVQVQAQMLCTGASHCYLVGLIGGDELVIRLIERNQRFIDSMIKELRKFWSFVERREMPPVDDSEATKAMLGCIYPCDLGNEISLPDNFIELDRELVELKEQIKTLETRKDGIENKIKAAIGDATCGVLPVGSYSWKAQTRSTVDGKLLADLDPQLYQQCLRVSSFRVLRRSGK